jgi:type IV secretion system protein TrbL
VLEYYLIAAVVGIFIPFGLLPHTKFLAEKAIGAVVAAGIKLMTLSFIVAAIQPVLANSMKFSSPDIPLNELFAMFLTVCALMFLTWKAPSLAAALMSGTPNLGAGDITSPVLAAAGAAIGTAAAIKTAGASGAATKAASGAVGGATSAAAGAGARSGSSALGSASAGSAAAAPASSSGVSGSSGPNSPPATSPATGGAASGGTTPMAAANRTLVASSQQSPNATERLPEYVAPSSAPSDSPRGAGLGPSSSESNTLVLPARSPA